MTPVFFLTSRCSKPGISNPDSGDLKVIVKSWTRHDSSKKLKNLTLTTMRRKFVLMRRFLSFELIFISILSVVLFDTCKKEPEKVVEGKNFDLFPLKVNNLFYYSYFHGKSNGAISEYTKGTEVWKVVSVSDAGTSFRYFIECKLSAIRIISFAPKDTIQVESQRNIVIDEQKSTSNLSFTFNNNSFIFERYQNTDHYVVSQNGGTAAISWSYVFTADSGLTKYTYYDPPNQIENKLLKLDSLRTYL